MRLIPQEAWPGLAKFNPDKLMELVTRSEKADPWDEDYKKLGAEIEQFLAEFKAFATPHLVARRRQILRKLCTAKKLSMARDQIIDKFVPKLCQLDLTWMESNRLNDYQQQKEEFEQTMSQLARAIAALEPACKRGNNRPVLVPGPRTK